MNRDGLAEMKGRCAGLTEEGLEIRAEIVGYLEALGVYEKWIIVQKIDGQAVANPQSADERTLSGGNEIRDDEGELGLIGLVYHYDGTLDSVLQCCE